MENKIFFVYDKNSLSMPKADLFQSMSRLLHGTRLRASVENMHKNVNFIKLFNRSSVQSNN